MADVQTTNQFEGTSPVITTQQVEALRKAEAEANRFRDERDAALAEIRRLREVLTRIAAMRPDREPVDHDFRVAADALNYGFDCAFWHTAGIAREALADAASDKPLPQAAASRGGEA
jgi:hypothetical protein